MNKFVLSPEEVICLFLPQSSHIYQKVPGVHSLSAPEVTVMKHPLLGAAVASSLICLPFSYLNQIPFLYT